MTLLVPLVHNQLSQVGKSLSGTYYFIAPLGHISRHSLTVSFPQDSTRHRCQCTAMSSYAEASVGMNLLANAFRLLEKKTGFLVAMSWRSSILPAQEVEAEAKKSQKSLTASDIVVLYNHEFKEIRSISYLLYPAKIESDITQ